ncbi:helix-turn-helix domain-containing protein [Streptomyces sp. NPDC060054]|uniref:helix-turn-helix domain-containing protein n=1 Tax=unclassified Streptomyces TaxID=2593676 RepID=UPI000A579DFB
MAEPVRARRLTDQEGQRLQQIVRRGRHESVRVRRALIIMASASGTPVTAIARLVAAHEDTVRDVIHAFNEKGLATLDPQWAGGRPRLIGDDEREFIIATAKTRPVTLGRPFTHWSLRKLSDYLTRNRIRTVRIGRERLRQILREHGISFQRTRTWKESKDPDKEERVSTSGTVWSSLPDRRSSGPRDSFPVLTFAAEFGVKLPSASWNSGRAGLGMVHRSNSSFDSSSGTALAKAYRNCAWLRETARLVLPGWRRNAKVDFAGPGRWL